MNTTSNWTIDDQHELDAWRALIGPIDMEEESESGRIPYYQYKEGCDEIPF
jgi:hypothetical protein